jgi:hypothetical protein
MRHFLAKSIDRDKMLKEVERILEQTISYAILRRAEPGFLGSSWAE